MDKGCKSCEFNGLFPRTISPRVNYLFCSKKACSEFNADFDIGNNICSLYQPFIKEDDAEDTVTDDEHVLDFIRY